MNNINVKMNYKVFKESKKKNTRNENGGRR